jgi:hypothetical protein
VFGQSNKVAGNQQQPAKHPIVVTANPVKQSNGETDKAKAGVGLHGKPPKQKAPGQPAGGFPSASPLP